MAIQLHQWTAGIYLLAGLLAGLGLALPSPRVASASIGLLVLGVVIHGLSFSVLHSAEPPPPLTDLPAAVSFMALVGTVFFLVLSFRVQLRSLVVFVAPVAFLGVFFAALRMPEAGPATTALTETKAAGWQPKGPIGALLAIGDPEVQKAVGFTLAIAKRFGAAL